MNLSGLGNEPHLFSRHIRNGFPITKPFQQTRFDMNNPDLDPTEWQKLVTKPYEVSAWAYFNRSYNLYAQTKADRTLLFYCAFELRCAIERVLYEYLSHIRNDQLPKAEQNLWSAKDLKAAILKIDPDFVAKIEFLNCVLEVEAMSPRFPVPDLDQLSIYYGRLGDYLHSQRNAGQQVKRPSWWSSFNSFIKELHDYLWVFVSQSRVTIKCDGISQGLLEDFKAARKTREDVIAALELEPRKWTVSSRFRWFHD
jgi:hypothetical protein